MLRVSVLRLVVLPLHVNAVHTLDLGQVARKELVNAAGVAATQWVVVSHEDGGRVSIDRGAVLEVARTASAVLSAPPS